MSLVALANVLLGGVMVRRFHADPRVRATELLLQERPPRQAPVAQTRPSSEEVAPSPPLPAATPRLYRSPHAPFPATQFLSNGSFVTAISQAGGGWSSCRGLSIVRRRDDPTADFAGHAIYLRDVRSGTVWSATFAPTFREPDTYRVTFLPESASIRRRDGEIDSLLEVAVSPEEDVEVRRLTLTNLGAAAREIEVTSAAEVVLARHEDDVAHPAFAKLFLETEAVPAHAALLCRRRPRAAGETPLWAVHVLAVSGRPQGRSSGDGPRAPPAVRQGTPQLEGSPARARPDRPDLILSPRQRVRLAPARWPASFTTAADSRETASLAQKITILRAVRAALRDARAGRQWHSPGSPQDTRLSQLRPASSADRSLAAGGDLHAANVSTSRLFATDFRRA